MNIVAKAVAIGLSAAMLTACAGDSGQKESIGTLLGAVGGGLAGAQVGGGRGKLLAVGAGTLLGAFVGNQVGKSLDRADELAMQQSTQQALETGRSGTPVSWRNPDSGHAGTVTPQPVFESSNGQYCREFQQTVTIDGQTQSAYGTACRQPDGSWKIVNG